MNTLNQVLIIQIQHLKILNQRLKALIAPPEDRESACEGSDSTCEDIESRTEEADSGPPGDFPNYTYKSMGLQDDLNLARNARGWSCGEVGAVRRAAQRQNRARRKCWRVLGLPGLPE